MRLRVHDATQLITWQERPATIEFESGEVKVSYKALSSVLAYNAQEKGLDEVKRYLDYGEWPSLFEWFGHIAADAGCVADDVDYMLHLHSKGLCQCGESSCTIRNTLHARIGAAITTGQYIGNGRPWADGDMWRLFWAQTLPDRSQTILVRADEIDWMQDDPLELEAGHITQMESEKHADHSGPSIPWDA